MESKLNVGVEISQKFSFREFFKSEYETESTIFYDLGVSNLKNLY